MSQPEDSTSATAGIASRLARLQGETPQHTGEPITIDLFGTTHVMPDMSNRNINKAIYQGIRDKYTEIRGKREMMIATLSIALPEEVRKALEDEKKKLDDSLAMLEPWMKLILQSEKNTSQESLEAAALSQHLSNSLPTVLGGLVRSVQQGQQQDNQTIHNQQNQPPPCVQQ